MLWVIFKALRKSNFKIWLASSVRERIHLVFWLYMRTPMVYMHILMQLVLVKKNRLSKS